VTKLDWRKAKSHETDPARQQPKEDFVEPDRLIVSVTPITRKELAKHLAKLKKERTNEARRWPSRIAAEAREAERLAEEAANKARREAAREARQRNLARKKARRRPQRRPQGE
jgi:hypothetical protein